MKKTLWTLNIENYAPALVELTYPLIHAYANKIGAKFQIINDRKFPKMPAVYEKLQIFELGFENDWNIYIDSDACLFPDMFDVTERISKDTVCHFATDFAGNRWRYDRYFRRDGRDIGSCNWFTVASDWCRDLWHPLDDLTLDEARARIHPIMRETLAGIDREHLIDDYILSRNIARFGLKVKTVRQIMDAAKDPATYFWHSHTVSLEQKISEIANGLAKSHVLDLPEIKETSGISAEDWLRSYGTAPVKKAQKNSSFSGSPNIRNAQKIYGWMSDVELAFLGTRAQTHKLIVEIGSFHGRSTRALADNTAGMIYAVDTWQGSPEHQGMPETARAEDAFRENLRDHIATGRVVPIKTNSLSAACILASKGIRPDMIFIDAAHDYESVRADIAVWAPLLADGGLLCGHDFGDQAAMETTEEWGVTRAVTEACPDFQRGPGSIWIKPNAVFAASR